MDPLQKLYQVETGKLVLVIGIITSIVIVTQFFLPPYENILSFLIPEENASVMRKNSSLDGDSSPKSVLGEETKSDEMVSNTELGEETKSETKGKDRDRAGYVFPLLTLAPAYFPINLSISKELQSGPAMPPIPEKAGLLQSGPTMPSKAEKPGLLQSHPAMPSKKEKHGLLQSAPAMHSKKKKPGLLQSAPATSYKNYSMTKNRVKKAMIKLPPKVITSISGMNVLLHQSRASSCSTRPQWSSVPDQEIFSAKEQIENAPMIKNDRELYAPLFRNVSMFKRPQWSSVPDQEIFSAKEQIENAPMIKNDRELYAPLFRNVSMFKRSYELMEQILKVFIYSEGAKPIFHQPILDGIYASEGWFMKLMESNRHFIVNDPKKAHLFYLPFSSQILRYTLYIPDSYNKKSIIKYLENYMSIITTKYPFWNRTGGADHFLAACHDWAPSETKKVMGGSIRALCNADVNEAGFILGKDVSLPETNIRSISNPLEYLGGKPPLKRKNLAFFASSMHGYLRPILLKHWGNKDPDIKIYGGPNSYVKVKNYVQYMRNSKYCICARGFEVNSPRVVEAIFSECVPVIISDNFVPPFFNVLDWEAFAVFVAEKDIPELKNILLSIPELKYLEMQKRVKKVQQHFLWHAEPVKYDIFHMILHSIWYNRVFQIQPR